MLVSITVFDVRMHFLQTSQMTRCKLQPLVAYLVRHVFMPSYVMTVLDGPHDYNCCKFVVLNTFDSRAMLSMKRKHNRGGKIGVCI